MSNRISLSAIWSVAYKEFLHIVRDRRVLALLIVLPPVFTLIFGHAFEAGEMTDAPALLINRDANPRTQRFVDLLQKDKTFAWRNEPNSTREADLLGQHANASLVVPKGWGDSLSSGEPKPLQLFLDGSDTNTSEQLGGSVRKTLGEFQSAEREQLMSSLPAGVLALAAQLPLDVRNEFTAAMQPWEVKDTVLYNPKEKFIEYVTPGVIGLILQLITVTLMACTIARERESGTLYQLMVTSLHRSEIVIGKILPYLAISLVLIAMIMALASWHFHVQFHNWPALAATCLLFLLCSLGLGLLISTFSKTQTQAIQFSVFFLLPVFVLSGAFAPVEQLPRAIRAVSELFPLTHFCRAFRYVNLYRADWTYYSPSLAVLFFGALVTFVGAGFLLRRIEE